MSKTLYLLRHAHAEQQKQNKSDFDRELDSAGESELEIIAEKALKQGVMPQAVFASSARRTTQTIQLFCSKIGFPVQDIQYSRELYHASVIDYRNLLHVLDIIDRDANTVLITGHNPTISDAAAWFGKKLLLELPTAGLVKITFDSDTWAEAGPETGKVVFTLFPGV